MTDVTLDQINLDGFEIKVHGKYGLIPVQAEPGSAGYDICTPPGSPIHMPFDSRRMIDTGIIVQTPIKLFMLLVPRSSTGTKRARSVRVANTLGIIDSSYQGQGDTVKVFLERGARRKTYVGTVTTGPGPIHPDTLHNEAVSQLNWEGSFQVTDAEFVRVHETAYDVFVHQENENDTLVLDAEQAFAQMIFIPYARPQLVEAALAEFSKKGRGGFGSTDK